MLSSLEIKNYAIIKSLSISFDKGLNIITGETGAGKSILLGALGLCLGDRVDTKVLYNADTKCIIEAQFKLANPNLKQFFENADLDYEAVTTIRREINTNGKSRAFVNDTPVTLDILKQLAEFLINLTSQNETQQLNQEKYQLAILDAIDPLPQHLSTYQKTYSKYQKIQKTYHKLLEEQQQLIKEQEFVQYQFDELENANLIDEDLSELENNHQQLVHAESIQQALHQCNQLIDQGEYASLQQLNSIQHLLNSVAKYNPEIAALVERIDSIIIELEDINKETELIASAIDYNQEAIDSLEEKLNQINKLLRKHQLSSIQELLDLKTNLGQQLQNLDSNDAQLKELQKELSLQEAALSKASNLLSDERKKQIPFVESQILTTLHKVGMPDALFKINLVEKDDFSINGKDKIQFKFTANKGFPVQAIQKIASGGELSRVLLSIQSFYAQNANLPTLIFDEIDTGISGETAAKVAEVFRQISQDQQLIAITHLPQIAAKASKHFFIYKGEENGKTITKMTALNDEKHIKAIARMLSGETITEASLNNAKTLIQQ